MTGGAPELNPNFRWLVTESKSLGRHVMDRCNLTILEVPAHRDLPEFFAKHRVEVVSEASNADGRGPLLVTSRSTWRRTARRPPPPA